MLDEVAQLVEERPSLIVNDLPADLLRPVQSSLLFECKAPAVGPWARMGVPSFLGRTALEALTRLVDGLKVKKNELTLTNVLQRLDRECGGKK